MDHRLPATLDMAREFSQLFVNRRAYTIQSVRPHPESGRHYYYRPKPKDGGEPAELTGETVRRHLAGEITIGIYAINAATQRCKWMAIDADYKTALEDLIKVQRQLQNDRIEAALEKSKRGGHLWIFFERPVLARDARTYIYHVAGKLEVQVKGTGLADGIEIFPKQDELRREEFGNAIRAPLGVHWGARESRGWRYWYYGADYKLEDQLAYLKGLRKVKEEHLHRMIAGKTIPPEFVQHARRTESPKYFESKPGEFRILEHVEVKRQAGRNWVTRCPSCAAQGHDKSGDNLAISVEEPRKYCCWAGCTRNDPRRSWAADLQAEAGVTGTRPILLASLRGALSDWIVVSGLLLAVFSQVCVWLDSGTWSPGCLCLQSAAMVIIAVAAECWMSHRKGRSIKDAEFGTTGRKRQGNQAAQPHSAW